ncbi:MAG: hypothetical protein M1812_006929 [Candelaria pacifica]|nr:MAG: hypothetical protein M1812_006929 [Candelaria pacifica]
MHALPHVDLAELHSILISSSPSPTSSSPSPSPPPFLPHSPPPSSRQHRQHARVMHRTIIHNGGKTLQHSKYLNSLPLACASKVRSKSQLSAIAKGLRRSNSVPQTFNTASRPERYQRDSADRSSRPRRPNYATRQEPENQKAPWQRSSDAKSVPQTFNTVSRPEKYQRDSADRSSGPRRPNHATRQEPEDQKASWQRTSDAKSPEKYQRDSADRSSGPRRSNHATRQESEDQKASWQRDSDATSVPQTFNTVSRPEKYQLNGADRSSRPRRANHATRQEPEDQKASWQRNFDAKSGDKRRAKKETYLRGGRSNEPHPETVEPMKRASTMERRKTAQLLDLATPWSSGSSGYEARIRERFEEGERAKAQDEGAVSPDYRGRLSARPLRMRSSPRPLRMRNQETTPVKERLSEPPLAIPYSTPASEFLYGTSVVTAALLARSRKLYKLYIYDGENREVAARDSAIYQLGLKAHVDVRHVVGDWIRMLDKMSTGRPHNGYILEASPLPKLPVTSLHRVSQSDRFFDVQLDHQSREEEAINGRDNRFIYRKNQEQKDRYPFVLLLDEILDPGNLGAILRSAFFLGVDAVAISTRNSAPFSPVMLKASAGASENIRILSVTKPAMFMLESINNGWQFYAAALPDDKDSSRPYLSTSNLPHLLTQHPCVLMLGGEGEGLRSNLRKKATSDVGIEGKMAKVGVDSLNVSVAAGILCEAFLRKGSLENLNDDENRSSDLKSPPARADKVSGDRLF